jgi:hypothetical protein
MRTRRIPSIRVVYRAVAWLAVLAPSVGAARADFVYGVADLSANLLQIDSSTGQVLSTKTITGTGGLHEDIVPDGQGQLLLAGYKSNAIGAHNLFRLDPATGAATSIGDITNGAGREYWVEGMAFVNGTLYASAAVIDISSGSPVYLGYAPDASDTLIKIDPATGHATEVGKFGAEFLNVEDIAYSPKYGLIGSDIGTLVGPAFHDFNTTPALIRIDPTTGMATKIADLPQGDLVTKPGSTELTPSGPFVAGLDFTPDGKTLYGATIQTHFGKAPSGFVTIDPTTGAITPISTINERLLDGITFVAMVPEPASVVLLAMGGGLAALAVARRRVSPAATD